MNRSRNLFCVLTLLALLAGPGPARACSACFGDPNSSMSLGLTWAISIMVGVVACVLAGVVTFFVRTARHTGVDTPPVRDDSETKEI